MKVPEKYRVKSGVFASDDSYGNNGLFMVEHKGYLFKVIASDGLGWEHASVSLEDRCPTWEEMCFIKDLFWGEDECVVQYHPPKSEYVNNHPNCLHLWKPVGQKIPTPPSLLVGVKNLKITKVEKEVSPKDLGIEFCGICGSDEGYLLSEDEEDNNDVVVTYFCKSCHAPEYLKLK